MSVKDAGISGGLGIPELIRCCVRRVSRSIGMKIVKRNRLMLRNYQKTAIRFAWDRSYCYLGLEPGLGKTLISLTLIKYLQLPTLVVSPKLVATITWPEEIAKWMPALSYSVVIGTPKQRNKAVEASTLIHLINYENLPWLIKTHKWKWKMVIMDEVTKMKTNGTRVKAFMKVRDKCERIIGLSGTPAVNSLMALFHQYKCIDGGATFGKFITHFRNKYFVDRGFGFPDWQIRPGGEAAILAAVKPTMITMRAQDYLPELPSVVTTRRMFELSTDAKKQYKEFEQDQVIESLDIIATTGAAKNIKLRQLTAGFVYDEDGVAHLQGKDKIDALKNILEEIGNEQVLIFYWHKAEAKLLKDIASPLDIDKWNTGELQYMMAQPVSVGHGLNLQHSGAHHIIYFTLPYDGEIYIQSIRRLLRSGNKATTIFVHQLVAKGTVDNHVARLLEKKMEQHQRLMSPCVNFW